MAFTTETAADNKIKDGPSVHYGSFTLPGWKEEGGRVKIVYQSVFTESALQLVWKVT